VRTPRNPEAEKIILEKQVNLAEQPDCVAREVTVQWPAFMAHLRRFLNHGARVYLGTGSFRQCLSVKPEVTSEWSPMGIVEVAVAAMRRRRFRGFHP
jgi:hypothetical protein